MKWCFYWNSNFFLALGNVNRRSYSPSCSSLRIIFGGANVHAIIIIIIITAFISATQKQGSLSLSCTDCFLQSYTMNEEEMLANQRPLIHPPDPCTSELWVNVHASFCVTPYCIKNEYNNTTQLAEITDFVNGKSRIPIDLASARYNHRFR